VEWLEKTLYLDLLAVLDKLADEHSLLDIGCGTGAFLKYAARNGWTTAGVEPSEQGTSMSSDLENNIYNMSIADFAKMCGRTFGAVTLLNVLEHVLNPVAVLEMTTDLLNPRGVLCIRVPNDFSAFQMHADKERRRWWITAPDHINYFNFYSLKSLLRSVGLEVKYATTDFPMEMFILMGDNYIGNPALGASCHKKRRNFELSISDKLRRTVYHSFAESGVGRSCIMFATKSGEEKK